MLNVAAIMGRLTADPELRHTPSDIAVTRFTLAVNRSYAKAGTERQTDFIDVVVWRGTAEFVCKYFSKGSMMAVSGSIQTGSYTDKDGNKRRTFEIVASDVNFADSKRDSSNSGSNNEFGTPPPQRAAFDEPAPAYSSGKNEDFEEILGDDDLPF
jgi:single stranded DNA-binding protein (ssb)